jgi:trk system potassium uptake protein TrkH
MVQRTKSTDPSRARTRGSIIDFQRISYVTGIMLLVMTVFMLPPAMTDIIAGNPDFWVFVGAAFVAGFLGLMMVMSSRGSWNEEIYLKEGFLLTASSWFGLSVVATIPFLFFGHGMSLSDAWFEAVSGLTTTGATVIDNLDEMPPGILLWRSTIQWVGGIGIVLMALIMLPFLRVGGMQLFQTENSDRSDKIVAKSSELVRLIAFTYISMTALAGISYSIAGMSAFDALNHAMTTIATGGFSTHDLSFGYFKNPAIHWLGFFFLTAASLPLVLYIKFVRTGNLSVWSDMQVRGFLKFVSLAIILLTIWYYSTREVALIDALRVVAFNSISIISTAGFALGDYTAWGPGSVGVFFLFMFMGGCTGSTTGGIKTFRFQVMLISAQNYVRKLISPNRVVVSIYNGKQITPEISTSVLAYLSVMFLSIMLFTLVLSFFGLDFIDSVSAATSALANVGPALGPEIGPAGTFKNLAWESKLLLTFGMLLGRLEFFTVLVIFSRDFWR